MSISIAITILSYIGSGTHANIMSTRYPRPRNVAIDGSALFANWEQWAKMKNPGFEWDGSDYAKASRCTTADVQGLSLYMKPLEQLLKLAPTGFPTHASLRTVFEKLQNTYKILGALTPKQEWPAIADATDKWRVMCKDCYELKKKPSPPADVKPLTDLIDLPAPTEPTAPATGAAASDGTTNSDSSLQRWPDFTELELCEVCDDDVTIVKETCKCSLCDPQGAPVPAATHGGQNKETSTSTGGPRRPRMPPRGIGERAENAEKPRMAKGRFAAALAKKQAAAKDTTEPMKKCLAPMKMHGAKKPNSAKKRNPVQKPKAAKKTKGAKQPKGAKKPKAAKKQKGALKKKGAKKTKGAKKNKKAAQKQKAGREATGTKRKPVGGPCTNPSKAKAAKLTNEEIKNIRDTTPRLEHTILTPAKLTFKKDGSGHLVEAKIPGINKPKGSTYILGSSKRGDFRIPLENVLNMIQKGDVKTIGEAKQEYERMLLAD